MRAQFQLVTLNIFNYVTLQASNIGFKLLGGAYITRETERASSLGATSPIHNSIEETHTCYNDYISFLFGKVVNGFGSVVLATHNFDSGNVILFLITTKHILSELDKHDVTSDIGKFAAEKAGELGIDKGDYNYNLYS